MAKRLAEPRRSPKDDGQLAGSPLDGPAAESGSRYLTPPPPREAWVGRLRYVVVPVIAVLAIVTIIYLLDDSKGADQTQVGAFSAVSISGNAAGALGQAPRVGNLAPEFTLTNLDSKQTKLSDFRGKTVFLNFFASWCPPCRAEMPDIAAVYQEYKDKDVVVLAVDMEEEPEVVGAYAKSLGLSFPIVLDRSGYVTAQYRITALPTSFFIDKEGVVREMQIGAMSKSLMVQKLAKAL